MKSLKLLNDNILIRKNEEEKEKRTASGLIHIPSTAPSDNIMGKVVEVGGGRVLESGHVVPMTVKQGDTVMFSPNSGMNIKFNGEEFVMLQEYSVLAIVSE